MANSELPALRWGIVGCGLISTWFVTDLMLSRSDALAKHSITAIGSSSQQKGSDFASKNCPSQSPAIYDSYAGVYADPNVDIVYIGTPHPMHHKNVLEAIAAGKHVLCEKPMAMNAQEGHEMIEAARKKGVFLMEAVWTRFFPVTKEMQRLIHEEKVIGDVSAVWVDFGIYMPISGRDPASRTVSKKLGAGALLDIGIYSLTWASLVLDTVPNATPEISANMIFSDAENPADRVDEQVAVVLRYPEQRAQAICTASLLYKTPEIFARIEGSKGTIFVGGVAASKPGFLIVKPKDGEEKRYDFPVEGKGFHYEADAVALDIQAGRLENDTYPLGMTDSILSRMDGIMATCGLSYSN
ncbi:hypothetical protein N0V90_005519 [Kalmusia sp. IMI 367209]|nr:hypothetical protein N0V90_005519 [Kalmusia sp. IMI 367209]